MTFRSPTLAQVLGRTAAIVALSASAWGVSAQTTAPQPGTAAQPAAATQQAAEPSAKDKASLEAAFARADANGDGKLSKEEASRLPAISAKFAELDKNKDGSLSLSEFAVGFSAAP